MSTTTVKNARNIPFTIEEINLVQDVLFLTLQSDGVLAQDEPIAYSLLKEAIELSASEPVTTTVYINVDAPRAELLMPALMNHRGSIERYLELSTIHTSDEDFVNTIARAMDVISQIADKIRQGL
jgi:hypothetical protein